MSRACYGTHAHSQDDHRCWAWLEIDKSYGPQRHTPRQLSRRNQLLSAFTFCFSLSINTKNLQSIRAFNWQHYFLVFKNCPCHYFLSLFLGLCKLSLSFIANRLLEMKTAEQNVLNKKQHVMLQNQKNTVASSEKETPFTQHHHIATIDV